MHHYQTTSKAKENGFPEKENSPVICHFSASLSRHEFYDGISTPREAAMAQFKDVFSTTAKVVLSLLIISAVIGAAYPILGGLGSASAPPNVTPSGAPGEEDADTMRTAAPPAAWNSLLAKAVANQCVTDGMNEAEVLRSIGEPNVRYDGRAISSWTWHPRQLNETTIFFTTKGTVYLWNSGCKSLNGIVTP
jgi:hypothetical protein